MALAFGQRVRALRKAQDWRFDGWVEQTGLGRGYISQLERGLVVPSLHALHRIARALELTVADLVAGSTARERLFTAAAGLPDDDLEDLLEEVRRLQEER